MTTAGRRRAAVTSADGRLLGLLTAGVSALGFALTLVLPEPAGLSLDDIAAGPPGTIAMSRQMAGQAPPR
jgi:hypothetical protein